MKTGVDFEICCGNQHQDGHQDKNPQYRISISEKYILELLGDRTHETSSSLLLIRDQFFYALIARQQQLLIIAKRHN